MKMSPLSLKLSMVPYVAAAALGIPASLTAQTNGTWINAAGGSWPTTTNWAGTPGVVAAGADAVADFSTVNITATRTITLDGARTAGTLKFGDATTVSNDQALNTGTAGSLTLDVLTGKAIIENQNRITTIGAVLAGNDGISITNGPGVGGTVVLGAANTFTGGLDITGTIVQFSNNASANTGGNVNTITLLAPTPAATPTRLLINGGVTNSSPINIPSPITGVAGTGLIQQTGTGLATLTGPITIGGGTSAGGLLVGGNAASNALVLNGVIDSTVNLTHRDGFIRYGGVGSNYAFLLVTNTALVGATNGISTVATVNLGTSANATLDLNGFDQTLTGVNFGYNTGTTTFTGTLNLGARTLFLNGDILTSGQSTAPHVINATTTGALNVGGTGRNIIVADTILAEDLIINGAALNGQGGFFKAGEGTVSLNSTTGTAPFFHGAGGLSIGRLGLPGTFSQASLTLDNGTRLFADVGPGGDLASAGTLTLNGVTNLVINQLGGALAAGTYPFLNYTGASPGLAGFNLLPVGHSTASLIDTGSAIALQVTANSQLTWDGPISNDWSVISNGNWKLPSGVADYIEGDDVIFPTAAVSTNVVLGQHVSPSRVTFTNDLPAEYTLTSAGNFGISAGASLIKNGTGKTILRNSNPYLGATAINAGTLELDHDSSGNTVITGSSNVSLAAGALLQLTRDDGGFTFTRNLSGSGTLQINAHSISGGVVAHTAFMTGTNTGFSGPIQLLSPLSGTYRLGSINPGSLGSGSIDVPAGAQLFTAANQIYPNAITLAGTGFLDAGGNIGALRLEGGGTWAGSITITGSGARIGSHNATATVSGPISGADLNVNGSDGTYNNAHTLIFTGTNSYGKTTIGGGSTATAVSSRRLNIGNGGTSGTLGSGPVEITGDGQNGVLGFDRLDGYTLAAGQTITNAGAQPVRTFLDVETRGTGFNQNGQAITLGAAAPALGGDIRVAQARAGSILNTNGPITSQQLRVSTGVTDGVLNINAGSVINVNNLYLGDAANGNATATQAAGTTVNVVGQVRVGHFGTESSVYNMNGGTLTLTGASPALTPSTVGAGAVSATGDNNINAAAIPAIVGGGIYLGIDGTGVLNQSGGTVTTNWIVLDNRGDSGPAANMPTGRDEYNLNAGTLAIRSSWGVLQRNATASFNLGGGTVLVDNTGTGTNTGANLMIPLDTSMIVSGSGSTLNTNGVGNGFALGRNILGTGSLDLTGGGTIKFVPATGFQVVSATLNGSLALAKEGAGTTIITSSAAGLTGPLTVTAGRLDLPANAAPSSVTLAAGAALLMEGATPGLTLNGGTLLFDPNSSSALTTPSLALNGPVLLDFSTSPLADGTYTVITYGAKSGAGSFAFAGAASYRNITVADTGTQIRVTLGGTAALAWKGDATTPNAWDINTTAGWASPGADKFFFGDSVLFDDTAVQFAVTVGAGVAPRSTRIASVVNNFTFTTAGTGIGGGGPLIKEGASTLTLAGPNSYSGRTEVRGGTLAFNSSASLGNGLIGNSILIDGTGRLSYTAATALDLGINRDIAVGATGGALSHNNATAAAISIPGRLSGGGPLSFHSAAVGTGTFILTGNNSGYSGDITVDAPASGTGGLTVLRPANQQAVPLTGSITLNYPVGAVTGNAVTLDLPNVTIPAGVTLNLTSHLNGAISLRTQVTTNAGNSVINGPIRLAGTSIIQLTLTTGTMTINGNITEGPGTFSNLFFVRGTGGTGFINGNINLPNATFSKTDANTWWINSTGHTWANTNLVVGGVTLGIANALPQAAPLVLGQNDANAVTFNLNGFNQTVASLASNPAAAGANTTGKAITSASPAVFTLNQESSTTYAGLLTGSVSFVKNGLGTLTLAGGSTFTGKVNINDGTVNAGGNTVTSLGSPTTAGRVVTVTTPASLNLTTNNVYGNGVGNLNLPTTVVDGTTLNTTRYNVLGPVTLLGATLSQDASDTTNYEGFQFRGGVTVGGTAVSTILSVAGKANHLGPDTVFTVADATAGPSPDLLVNAPFRDQSGDFGLAAGGLTKAGPGTMEIQVGSAYSGATNINGGVLLVNNFSGTSATGSSPVAVNAGGTLGGGGFVTGPVTVNSGGTLSPGNSPGILTTAAVTLAGNSSIAWEVADWTGASGAGFDSISASSLVISATPASPVIVRVRPLALVNYSSASRSFLLATTTGGITGFDAASFLVDSSAFTAGTGSWTVSKSANDLLLNFSPGTSSAYDLWTALKGLTGIETAFTADPDSDGMVNLAEFALNSEPKSAINSGKVRVAVANLAGQDYLTLTLPVLTGISFAGTSELAGAGSGIRYRIQGDNALNTWTADIDEVTPALSASLPVLDSGWTYRTFRHAAAISFGTRQFIRAKFEVAP